MTDAKIFQQGTIVRCSSCGSRNWHELSSLQQEFKCSGLRCTGALRSRSHVVLQVEHSDARRDSTPWDRCFGKVLWPRAREKAKHSFIFSPGISFFERYADRSPKVEVDAVCLVDGGGVGRGSQVDRERILRRRTMTNSLLKQRS